MQFIFALTSTYFDLLEYILLVDLAVYVMLSWFDHHFLDLSA